MTQVGIVRAALNTGSTGTQDFRVAGMTETPNAALFILTNATADGTPATDALISFGAADGANQWAIIGRDTDGQASTSNRVRSIEDGCICVIDTSNVIIGQAGFSSFLADAGSGAGVQINISNAFETAYLLTIILFSVPGARAGSYTTGAAVNDTTSVSGLSFDPNVLIAACGGIAIPANSNPILYSLGLAVSGSGQECIGFRDSNGGAVGLPSFRIFDSRVAAQVDINGNVAWSSELTSWDTGGFTVTQRSLGGSGDEVGYLVLDTGDRAAWCGIVTSPTSTGNQAITSPTFTPQFVMQILANTEATETAYTDNRAGSWGVGAFTANDEYSNTISVEDAADTTNTQSLSDDVAVNLPDDDGIAQCVASFGSFDANGWTLNHSSVAATAKKWIGFAIEAEATAGQPSLRRLGHMNLYGSPIQHRAKGVRYG